jgi:hypothetical protein
MLRTAGVGSGDERAPASTEGEVKSSPPFSTSSTSSTLSAVEISLAEVVLDDHLSRHLIVPYFVNSQGVIKRPEPFIAWWSRIFSFLGSNILEYERFQLRCFCRLFRDALLPPRLWLPFPEYSTGNLVERPNRMKLVINYDPFEFSATITATSCHYGIILSCDRSCDGREQFRLELYKSGRIGLAMGGTRNQHRTYGGGDPNGYRPDLCSPPIPMNEPVHLTVRRSRTGDFSMYVNHALVSTVNCGSISLVATGSFGRTIRLGSRLPRHGNTTENCFNGSITNARLFISGSI